MIRNNKKLRKEIKPCTELQTLAQKENYAIFILKGMLGNLTLVNKVTITSELRREINQRISVIKERQQIRKDAKQNETKSKKSQRY